MEHPTADRIPQSGITDMVVAALGIELTVMIAESTPP
jgi:hypothetical protein